MMDWSISTLSNHKIYSANNQYQSRYVNDTNENICSYADIHIFVPFALFRKHRVWEFYFNCDKSKREMIMSHLEWIDERITILKDVTISGLLKSTHRLFTLHLLIDDYKEFPFINTSVRWLLSNALKNCGFNYEIHSVGLYPCGEPYYSYPKILTFNIRKILLNRCNKRQPLGLIRLDSDDTLMPNYLRMIDQIYNALSVNDMISDSGAPVLIDIPYGIQYASETLTSYTCLWPESNFTALLTCMQSLENHYIPFDFAHDEIPSDLNRQVISTSAPAWIQGIHTSNEQNSVFTWAKPYLKNVELEKLMNKFL